MQRHGPDAEYNRYASDFEFHIRCLCGAPMHIWAPDGQWLRYSCEAGAKWCGNSLTGQMVTGWPVPVETPNGDWA